MNTLLAPADAEVVGVAIVGNHASTRVPTGTDADPRPDNLVRIRRQGGVRVNRFLSAPRLTVECWGVDEEAAFANAQDAWAKLAAAEGTTVEGVWIARVELTEPANFPDDNGDPRFQFVAVLTTNLMRSTP